MAAVLLPVPSLVLAAVWGVVLAVTRVSALASIAVAVGFPVAAVVVGRPWGEVAALAACSALVVFRHTDNLRRLARGEEAAFRGRSGRTSSR
jgi:glycerol-3-phosphate acyltransferase PlsY